MKKFITICLMIAAGVAQAQQKPIYTQYILNNYILNPAITGIENYTDLKFSYRNQWVGIDGAPVTSYMSIHGPIGKKDYRTSATSFQIPGENPRGRSYMEEYTAPEPHHGIGGTIVSDKTGYMNRWGAYLTYAYHKGLTPRTTLSGGFMLGMTSVNIDASKINWGNTPQDDPAVGYASGEISKIKPEIGAGLWLYGADYFAGISVMNIVPAKMRFINDNKYGASFLPHYFITAGYKVFLGDDLSLTPSIMLQYVQPAPMQPMVNAKLQYRDLAWIGSSFRFGDQLSGFAAMAGMNISNTFNIGYAYDVAPSALNQYSRNTHEIIIGFLIGNRFDDSCPRQNW
ncbi:MAG TPA: type IX secretion system membrane protein PorP/SprF [Ferruginibacter sp.]|nr:type IX secretion system membrane protein PorP/SprF [Ferruginibacter sp.]HMP20560.1 type IX secretion system membrane protein PorP/SprF [Ferruginibacter sp.]